MEKAQEKDLEQIVQFYREVIAAVNQTSVKLGWDADVYPGKDFVTDRIRAGEMLIIREGERIVAAAAVNHQMNPEYEDIDWRMKGVAKKTATIHALATAPDHRGGNLSDMFLQDIEAYCLAQGDEVIHLDVIDTNIPAYKMYLRNHYEERACIKMFYESVGTREFWMMEKILGN